MVAGSTAEREEYVPLEEKNNGHSFKTDRMEVKTGQSCILAWVMEEKSSHQAASLFSRGKRDRGCWITSAGVTRDHLKCH